MTPAHAGNETAISSAPSAWHALTTRRSVPPALLAAPGPSRPELVEILSAASRVPDHGMIVPWRFVVVEARRAETLCDRLCAAHAASDGDRDPSTVSAMTSKLRSWLIGPPVVVFLVSCPDPAATIIEREQVLAAAAVATTLLHAATARGFGAIWLTGWPAYAPEAHAVLGLAPGESVIGLFPIGTPLKRPAERPRPIIDRIVTDWIG